jgi:hypothetical protein
MISKAPKTVLVGFVITTAMLAGAVAATRHYSATAEHSSRHVVVLKGEVDRTVRFRAGCDDGYARSCAFAFGEIDWLKSRIAALSPSDQNTSETMLIKSSVQQLEDWRRNRIEAADGRGPAYQLRLWAQGSAQRGQLEAAKRHLQAADMREHRNLPIADTTGAGYLAVERLP